MVGAGFVQREIKMSAQGRQNPRAAQRKNEDGEGIARGMQKKGRGKEKVKYKGGGGNWKDSL